MIKKLAVAIVLVTTASIFIAGCTTQTTSPTAAPTPTPSLTSTSTPSGAVQNKEIYITDMGVSLYSNITVKRGASVTWTNYDFMSHRITSETGVFDSGDMGPSDHFTYQFNETEIFPYRLDGVAYSTGFPRIVVQ